MGRGLGWQSLQQWLTHSPADTHTRLRCAVCFVMMVTAELLAERGSPFCLFTSSIAQPGRLGGPLRWGPWPGLHSAPRLLHHNAKQCPKPIESYPQPHPVLPQEASLLSVTPSVLLRPLDLYRHRKTCDAELRGVEMYACTTCAPPATHTCKAGRSRGRRRAAVARSTIFGSAPEPGQKKLQHRQTVHRKNVVF